MTTAANPPAAPVRKAGGRNLELPEHLKAYKGVWVFVEHDRGHVHGVSWELVGEARKLADKLGATCPSCCSAAPTKRSRRSPPTRSATAPTRPT
jgi:hypothetical protein